MLKVADNDALVTCKKKGGQGYRVVSQNVKYNKPEEIDTGNKFLNTLGKIAAKNKQEQDKNAYEATTVFRCY